MQILNIAGYKFTHLSELETLRENFLAQCRANALKGTILLSDEGINISLAGATADVDAFRQFLRADERFSDITFRESFSETQPFLHLKVKLKKEIITFRQSDVNATKTRAPDITPEEFKQWLDEKRDITVLDTRNDYEVRFGTFAGAINLHLQNFGELPAAVDVIDRDKPIVMFCTGGIRCEKAALYMMGQGFTDVRQLDGGILNYFAKVGGVHYEGECFVFDDRIAVDSNLQHTGTIQCTNCQGPVTQKQQELPTYIAGISCPACR